MIQTYSSPDLVSSDDLSEMDNLLGASSLIDHPIRNEVFERLVSFLASVRGRFSEVMHEENISFADLSRRMGKNRSIMTRFFRSESDWKGATIFHIANALECDIEVTIKKKEKNIYRSNAKNNEQSIIYENAGY